MSKARERRPPLRRLPLITVAPGTVWHRIHRQDQAPLWFGPPPGRPPRHRFDAPDGVYRVCYLGETIEACFAETFLRNPPVELIDLADLEARAVATMHVRRPLRLVPLYGPALAKLGVTAAVTSGERYQKARALARALWSHHTKPHGLCYLSRHDNSCSCIALFDRAASVVRVVSDAPLAADRRRLGALLQRWELGVAP